MPYRVSKSQFGRLVEQALAELPPRFAAALEEVPVEIHDASSGAQRRKMGLGPNQLLLGLYQGVALTNRNVEAPALPAIIYIFQADIEAACDSEAELVRQVRTTVLHEIGHHFGLDEEDLAALGYG